MTRNQNNNIGETVLNIQDKTFDVSVNIRDINWNRQPSTLPSTCLVRVIIQVTSLADDSVPYTLVEEALRKAIIDDIQKRYRVVPHDFSVTDLKMKIV
tara:strand:+ start:1092 stop:1385 length:294 start_codon:yes stop_codon:yes gene_type:complete